MRCFLALELPDRTKEALAQASRVLMSRFPGARWVRPESFHVTLAFLGEIEGAAVECAEAAADAAAGLGAFDLGFTGLLGLPERGPARVLAVRADRGLKECERVYEAVNRALADSGRARGLGPLNPEWPDGRPFRVHITLARAGGRPFPRATDRAWELARPRLEEPARVSRCILYRSELGRGGARYDIVRAAEL